MWKSLCLVLLFMYFIPSSDATCKQCELQKFCADHAKQGGPFDCTGLEKINSLPTLLTKALKCKVNLCTLEIPKFCLNTDVGKPDDIEIFLALAIDIDIILLSIISGLDIGHLAHIDGYLTLALRIQHTINDIYTLLAMDLIGCGELNVSALDNVLVASVGGACYLQTCVKDFLLDKLKDSCNTFMDYMNGDHGPKGCCDGKPTCPT